MMKQFDEKFEYAEKEIENFCKNQFATLQVQISNLEDGKKRELATVVERYNRTNHWLAELLTEYNEAKQSFDDSLERSWRLRRANRKLKETLPRRKSDTINVRDLNDVLEKYQTHIDQLDIYSDKSFFEQILMMSRKQRGDRLKFVEEAGKELETAILRQQEKIRLERKDRIAQIESKYALEKRNLEEAFLQAPKFKKQASESLYNAISSFVEEV